MHCTSRLITIMDTLSEQSLLSLRPRNLQEINAQSSRISPLPVREGKILSLKQRSSPQKDSGSKIKPDLVLPKWISLLHRFILRDSQEASNA